MASNQLIARLASEAGVTETQYYNTLMKTIMPGNVTAEQVLAFLQVAGKYHLNPLTREIYAFPAKGGGIQPVVGVDGWLTLANRHGDFDGLEYEDVVDTETGELLAITCKVYRKDRKHPICATEYMAECKRGTEPWKQWPRRMLRHKATIQGLRMAFGFSGIVDPDEAERWHDATPDSTEVKDATERRTQEIREKLQQATEVQEINGSLDAAEVIYEMGEADENAS